LDMLGTGWRDGQLDWTGAVRAHTRLREGGLQAA